MAAKKKKFSPILFSQHFKVPTVKLKKLGVLNATLNGDTKLFIDPLLLQHSEHKEFRKDAMASFNGYFSDLILLLSSAGTGSAAMRKAERMLTFKDPRETCLGYGDENIRGSSLSSTRRKQILSTAHEIIDLGFKEPRIFALMPVLEEGVGPDNISDLTTQAIKPALFKWNAALAKSLGVPTEAFEMDGTTHRLARNPCELKQRIPVLLVPIDILGELPVANDWSDVATAAARNQELRDQVSSYIGNIWALHTREEKRKARDSALSSKDAFASFLAAVEAIKKVPYDADADPKGHLAWRELADELIKLFPVKIEVPKTHGVSDLEKIVDDIITAFTDLIENKGQWYHLWHGDHPRHEHAAQKLFSAIADLYCRANNIDVSPESNNGVGPVDFKFSKGYDARVLVEVKLSTGAVVHGYETQLELYKKAESTFRARFLVIDVNKMGEKLTKIMDIRNKRIAAGEVASKIVVVDGTRKLSASKR